MSSILVQEFLKELEKDAASKGNDRLLHHTGHGKVFLLSRLSSFFFYTMYLGQHIQNLYLDEK